MVQRGKKLNKRGGARGSASSRHGLFSSFHDEDTSVVGYIHDHQDKDNSNRQIDHSRQNPRDLPPSSSSDDDDDDDNNNDQDSSDDESNNSKKQPSSSSQNNNNPKRNMKLSQLNELVKSNNEQDNESSKPSQLNRREREELQKQKAREAYFKATMEGKTEQARADLARLAIIKKQREEAARKKQEEQQAKKDQSVKSASLNAGKAMLTKTLGK